MKMKAATVYKSDVEDDTAATAKDNGLHPVSRHSSQNLIAKMPLAPKIEPATFVSSYQIIVTMVTHVEVYNSIDEIHFDSRVETSNTKNQCDRLPLYLFCSFYLIFINRESDSQDDSMTSADNHSEHSIQLRKAKKAKKIQDNTTMYVLSYHRE